MRLLIGTYTEVHDHVEGHAEGVLVADYDEHAASLDSWRTVAARSPSWLALSPTTSRVYAVVEAGGSDRGEVAMFSREGDSLELAQVEPSGGTAPAHLALDPAGTFLAVANYADGVVSVFAVQADGRLGPATDVVQHTGSSVHPIRQVSPHPHHVCFDVVTGELLVTDLGLDAIVRYSIDDAGQLTRQGRTDLPPGSGPRHTLAHPDGQHLLVISELENTVTVLTRRGTGFEVVSTVSTLPEDATGPSFASALVITRTGDVVYAANRGHDSIAVFAWDAGSATLALEQCCSSRGTTPRDIALSPDETLLLAANQDSDSVVTFSRDAQGLLTFRESATIPTPVCLVFDTGRS
ncbi:lactonase family protein [Microcella sp.]|uniref:lactonase family protein n=1 Tax=Microcella sp. TaxID=1913979 RepID=UPI0025682687|nr:lactonase family protein [Microcella sp.]MBX9471677.1 lactonase family protein [Microcella sp.]